MRVMMRLVVGVPSSLRMTVFMGFHGLVAGELEAPDGRMHRSRVRTSERALYVGLFLGDMCRNVFLDCGIGLCRRVLLREAAQAGIGDVNGGGKAPNVVAVRPGGGAL